MAISHGDKCYEVKERRMGDEDGRLWLNRMVKNWGSQRWGQPSRTWGLPGWGRTSHSKHGNCRSRALNLERKLELELQWGTKTNRVPNFKELIVKWRKKKKNLNQINHIQNVKLQSWYFWSVWTIEVFGCIRGGGWRGRWHRIHICFSQI